MPAAIYIAKTSQHVDEAKDFLALRRLGRGHARPCRRRSRPPGRTSSRDATLPADALPAVHDIQTYLDDGAAVPALEFLSPVKGPSLEQITVAVGSGLNTAEEAAALYDQDVEKQAKQLGLPGWE